MIHNFQERLDAAFPPSADNNLARGVTEGILLADGAMASEPFLRNAVGRDLRGHIRRCGILFRIHEMAEAGDLPFVSAMRQMPRGSWHWIELRSAGFKSHICRSEGPAAFPEDTPTRQDDRLVNQLDLFRPRSVDVEPPELCAWLTYSIAYDGSLGHLCWGVPNAAGDEWLARTNVLVRMASTARETTPETVTKGVELRFKEHIEAALSKSRGDAAE